jgi:hypothetical protein
VTTPLVSQEKPTELLARVGFFYARRQESNPFQTGYLRLEAPTKLRSLWGV